MLPGASVHGVPCGCPDQSYTFIAPCQLHRFIELLKESGISLSGKYTSQIATSKHFYDVTAHRYVMDNCHDMGMKIFRDLIYLMRGMMKADHKFYKAHGCYDFPQKHQGTVLKISLAGMLIGNKKLKAKMGNKMNEGMLMPYRKVLEKH